MSFKDLSSNAAVPVKPVGDDKVKAVPAVETPSVLPAEVVPAPKA